ncbi:hypothetical protein EV356DRAFT_1384 [Viridothelium virens]|uniref:Uncharacterized protein n=1 Tax=Viridothelium virens TaxID=1048519 RepID=A0A6A6HNZ5_VIRVR|nr:hypothetical protein EV356DRAFT_1384 [Viridothelium virens]
MGSQCSVDDGGKRWLATSFGCCAPRFREKEDLEDLEEAARQTREEICEQQPQRFSLPHAEPALARPSTSYSTKSFSTLVAGGWDAASRVTTRTSASFWRPKTAESRQQLVIGAPSDFRRVDSVPIPRRRRQEFRPLELSIYLPHNRLSPLPDFSKSDWSAKPLDLEVPRPAMIRPATDPNLTFSTSTFVIQRKPVESASFLVSPSILDSNHSSLIYGSLAQDEPPTLPSQLPTVPPQSHSSSLVRSGTQSTRASDGWDITDPTSPPSSRSRALSEPLGLSRRQSNQSRGNRSDVDEAIRELNTIVEERRADANVRPGNDEDAADKDEEAGGHSPAHVPAIAPSMKMRVRTETLSDIGSALSIPHTSKLIFSMSHCEAHHPDHQPESD